MERDVRFDLGRIVAALFVVYLHHAVLQLQLYGRIDPLPWHVANLIQMTGHFAVPMFFMMSGALLLGRPAGEIGPFLRRRVPAALVPYLAGAVFYLLYQGLAQGRWPASPHAAAFQILSGNAAFHLYFLWILLLLYLLTPLLADLGRLPRRTVVTATAILFAIAILEPHLVAFGLTLGFLSLGLGLSFLPYFLAGYAMTAYGPPPLRLCTLLFAGMAAAGTALIWAGYASGLFTEATVSHYLALNTVLMSLGAFGMLLHVRVESPRARRLVARLAELTLGIYVLHVAVTQELAAALARVAQVPPLPRILLLPLASFVLTALLVAALRRIPGARRLL